MHELVNLLEKGACTSEEIVTDVLDSIGALDKKIQAYVFVDREACLEQAQMADQARQAGKKGSLLGVPIAIKDVLNVKGDPCTCASKIMEGYTASYDATVISRLREEGAVLLGRVNMDEFAMGSSTENSALKVTRNPWNTDYVPGGSSGGSAAAVAADEAIASLGSDTGGSIRQPAAFCGCVGLKPTYGRVSRYGLVAYASSLDQIGPITKDVRDSAILLEAISGYDQMDSTSVDMAVPDFQSALKEGLEGARLGLPAEYFVEGVDPEVREGVDKAIEQCRSLGAETVEVDLPHTSHAIAAYYIIANAEASANLARFDGVRYGARIDGKDPIDMYAKTREQGFGEEVKRRIILGTYVLSSGYYDAYYLRAQKVRTLIRNDFEKAFESCDALLTPTTPTAAFAVGEKKGDPLQMYLNDVFTVTANLAGICGISVPCGFTSKGLPIGLQILGPAYKEENVLNVAYAYEQAAGRSKV
ncbi:MAG: Asp-tRNA(Asn)/Glu-tRNA(Gln) amidotransferase subunit GatA [Kiritimatiellae bacterium]|nr:Asp-tRNA(Asn)/Glu-tRNA(Gln) amidotransferase subunit GatA [Kiritimatiellia bacterium]